MIVPHQYKHIWNFNPETYAQNRCLGVSKDMKYRGVVDYKTGEEILPCKYHQPYYFEVDDGEYFVMLTTNTVLYSLIKRQERSNSN